MGALDILADVEQQILQNGAAVPATTGPGSWQAVAFEQGGIPLLLDMSRVREVLPLPVCTRIPGVKNWVVGIANVRGQILPVIDLGSFLEQAPSRSHPSHRVLVIKREDTVLGVLVDRVLGMKQVTDLNVSQADAGGDLPESVAPYCDGTCEAEGGSFGVFNMDKLLSSAAFSQIVLIQESSE